MVLQRCSQTVEPCRPGRMRFLFFLRLFFLRLACLCTAALTGSRLVNDLALVLLQPSAKTLRQPSVIVR